MKKRLKDLLLEHTSLVLFALVFAIFGALSPRFLAVGNLVNILVQSSVLIVGAVGMTFVLLTAGIDLSVGSIMFVAAVPAGKLVMEGHSVWLALMVALLVSLVFGAINALLIVRLRVMAFVVTLATLYIGRGFGLYVTQTRAMNLPESILAVGSANVLGIPLVLWVAFLVAAAGHYVLSRTSFGRQVYAVGQDLEGARKAGLPVDRIRFVTIMVCALSAGIAGFVTIARVGVVSPSMGNQRELAIIAAAVLGGTSLFGGRGQVFPGTIVGAILIQTVETGLVILNVNPYLYPLITAGIIFAAVAIDSMRNLEVAKQALRKIRPISA
jgi:ribose transport system permease protein